MRRGAHPWFARTFDAGSKPKKVVPPADRDTLIRMRERARVLGECARLANVYEKKGADAGIVRVILESRTRAVNAELALLDEAPTDRWASGGGESVGASSSGSAPFTLEKTLPVESGENPAGPLDSPLDGEPRHQHRGFPSSGPPVNGTSAQGPLGKPFTDVEEAQLRGIVRGFDMAFRALAGGGITPQSLRVGDPDKPHLKVVK